MRMCLTDLILTCAMLSSGLNIQPSPHEHGLHTDPPVEHSHPCGLPMPHAWPPTVEADILPLRATPQDCGPVSRRSVLDRKWGFEGRLLPDIGVRENT